MNKIFTRCILLLIMAAWVTLALASGSHPHLSCKKEWSHAIQAEPQKENMAEHLEGLELTIPIGIQNLLFQ